MLTINHLYYPGIIDSIFQHAPPASLVVMAQTCRKWRQRALGTYYHIRDMRAPKASRIQVNLCKPNDIKVELDKTTVGLLAGCKVLDLRKSAADGLCACMLRFLPNLDTVRYFVDAAFKSMDDWFILIPARQLVLQHWMFPIFTRAPQVKRLVLHCGVLDTIWKSGPVNLSGLVELEELVLLFEDAPSWLRYYEESSLETDLSVDTASDYDSDEAYDEMGLSDLRCRCPVPDSVPNSDSEDSRDGQTGIASANDDSSGGEDEQDNENNQNTSANTGSFVSGNDLSDHNPSVNNQHLLSSSSSTEDSGENDPEHDELSDVGPTVPFASSDTDSLRIEEESNFVLGRATFRCIRKIIKAAVDLNAAVTFVGLERWNPKLYHGLNLQHEPVLSGIEDLFFPKHRGDVIFVTVETYRRFVGEKKWAVETYWYNPLSP